MRRGGLLLAATVAAVLGGPGEVRGQTCQAGLSLPAVLSVAPGEVVSIPFTLTDVTGLGVISGDVTILYDASVITATSASPGPLAAGCTLTPNLSIAGRARLSLYCTEALEGAGTLVHLEFQVAGAAAASSPLAFDSAQLNEGTPSLCAASGSLRVCGPGDDTCDGLDQDCDGVADDGYPAQAFACAPPQCGLSGSRTCVGGVEVQTCQPGGRISLPGAIAASPGFPVQVPVLLSDVGGQGVLSADIVLTYDPAVALATQVSAGSLTSGSSCVLTSNPGTPGMVALSVYCTHPLAGPGTLAVLEFQALPPGGVTPLTLASAALNEGDPPVCVEDGSMEVCAGDATVRIPDGLADPPGSMLSVPLEVSDLTGLGVLSADVRLGFDPAVLQPVAVSAGSVSTGCTLTANLSSAGAAALSIFCTVPRSGGGTLAIVRFRVAAEWCAGTPVSLTRAVLNEGEPAVCRDAGSFRSEAAELCDGRDNDCNGIDDDGFNVGAACGAPGGSCPLPAHLACTPDGAATECRNDPTLDVTLAAGGMEAAVQWQAITGAAGYDVIRGGLQPLRAGEGDFTSATQSCLADDAVFLSLVDAEAPPAGEGWWYLMRAAGCTGADTYETGVPSQVGTRDPEVALAPARCP
jgi:hypothetical protein